ncbi:hypothetical protein DL96DRAFT_1812856 [Flagelloscypha sp. PMI_526]|nr:hypothetical protein DL96DRAFT_1812856 [Flagelloscypha sp. PMI_526]
MSLGPSFTRIGARNPIADLFSQFQSEDFSTSQGGERPDAAAPIPDILDVPVANVGGPLDIARLDNSYYKRDSEFTPGTSHTLEDINLQGMGDLEPDSLFGPQDLNRWLQKFPARDEDHSASSKTYQKLHRALKSITAKEID